MSGIASDRELVWGGNRDCRDWLHHGHNRIASFNALTVLRKVLDHYSKDLSYIIADRKEGLLDDTYLWGKTNEI